MLNKIGVFFILIWLLFLVCPLYAQDVQTNTALELTQLKNQVQGLNERVQELESKKDNFENAGNIATVILAVFTIVLAGATVILAWATWVYAKATRELVAVNKILTRATKLSAIVQAALNWVPNGKDTAYWYNRSEFKSERGNHEAKIAEKLPSFIAEMLADEESKV